MDIQTKYQRNDLKEYEELDIVAVLEEDEFNYVYRPGDDSYLLLDALRFELDKIIAAKPLFMLEIGCGSGFIINNLAHWLKEEKYNEGYVMATDINYDAGYLAKKVSNRYGNGVEIFHTNIVSGLAKLEKSVDIVICNPPYVPTEAGELEKYREYLKLQNTTLNENPGSYKRAEKYNGIDASYAGGESGNEVTVKILEKVKTILSDNGIFYLLLIEDNKPYELIPQYFPEDKYSSECLLFRQYYNEKIYIFKIVKK